MARVCQGRRCEDDGLDSRVRIVQIDLASENSIQEYAGDPRIGPAIADPADRGSVERQCGLLARCRRDMGVPATPIATRVPSDPTGGVGHVWIGILQV